MRVAGKGQSLPASLLLRPLPCLHQVLWPPSPTRQSLPKKTPQALPVLYGCTLPTLPSLSLSSYC